MGEAGIRAVALCNDQIIEELNSRYVPVFIDDLYTRDLSGAGPLAAILQHQYGAKNYELQRPPSLVQVFVVTTGGEVVSGPEVMSVDCTQTLLALLHANDAGVQPGPTLAHYTSTSPVTASKTDLQMRVVGRLDKPATYEDLGRLNPGASQTFFFDPTFNAPTRDWAVLKRDQWQALLPPAGTAVGASYAIPSEVASAIVIHFYSAWAPLHIEPELVRQVSMTGTLIDDGRVSLSAHFDMWNPGQRGSSPRDMVTGWVIGDVIGTLQYDPATAEIADIKLATTQAAHHTQEGFQMPYSVAAYRVP